MNQFAKKCTWIDAIFFCSDETLYKIELHTSNAAAMQLIKGKLEHMVNGWGKKEEIARRLN